MKIKELELSELKAYENNPRNNDDAVGPVAESIKEFGFKVPIVVDKDNVIIAGHTRLKAAMKLGLETVPCIVADDLTEEQVKAFRLADNKVGEIADWDFDLLGEELDGIFEIDMDLFGFEVDLDIEPQSQMEDIADNEEMQDSTLRYEHVMRIDKLKIVLTDDEYEDLVGRYNSYIDENGVSFGFARSLLND